jgi:hypothetical protein
MTKFTISVNNFRYLYVAAELSLNTSEGRVISDMDEHVSGWRRRLNRLLQGI